jgi:hypothetical protein
MIVVAGIVVFWYPPIAAIFLIGGLCFIWRGVHLDGKYGKDRPTVRDIDKMSKDEFQQKLRDPKFRLWVDKGLKFNIPSGIDVDMK